MVTSRLGSFCIGDQRFIWYCFSSNLLLGDSGGPGHHSHSCLLRTGGLVFLRQLLRGEFLPWSVKAERARDIHLTSYLSFSLGPRRALWSYLQEAWVRERTTQQGRKKKGWMKILKERRNLILVWYRGNRRIGGRIKKKVNMLQNT